MEVHTSDIWVVLSSVSEDTFPLESDVDEKASGFEKLGRSAIVKSEVGAAWRMRRRDV